MKKKNSENTPQWVSEIKLYYPCKTKIYLFHLKFTDLFHRQKWKQLPTVSSVFYHLRQQVTLKTKTRSSSQNYI